MYDIVVELIPLGEGRNFRAREFGQRVEVDAVDTTKDQVQQPCTKPQEADFIYGYRRQ